MPDQWRADDPTRLTAWGRTVTAAGVLLAIASLSALGLYLLGAVT